MKPEARWIVVAAVLLFLAVSAGAFGAHALKERFDDYQTAVYEKAVFYHFVHALGLLIVAIMPTLNLSSQAASQRIACLLLVGIIFFSGSLYALALTNYRLLGAVTPIGGTAFLLAWGYLAIDVWNSH